MSTEARVAPSSYIWRRVHSIFGLLIVLFLIEHIVTNSQAALLIGDNGEGFVRAVNLIKHLPFLPVIEVLIIGVPILVHAFLGVKYLFTSKVNSIATRGARPSLSSYPRNVAYTWQRITSWILLVGIILHVGYMRFYKYPLEAQVGSVKTYFARVDLDDGLYTVASRLGVKLYAQEDIAQEVRRLPVIDKNIQDLSQVQLELFQTPSIWGASDEMYSLKKKSVFDQLQKYEQEKQWINKLSEKKIRDTEVIAACSDFGTATLLVVREAFSSTVKGFLYTIFVLSAAFHAFNGLWTFLITWGVVIRLRSQKSMVNVCYFFMLLIALLGLASIWVTYWINLPR